MESPTDPPRTTARLLFAGWIVGMSVAYVLFDRRPELGLAVFALTWVAFVGGMVWNARRR